MFDYVVTVSENAHDAAASLDGRDHMHWPFPLDCAGGELAYRRLVVSLRRRIELFVTVIDKERTSPR